MYVKHISVTIYDTFCHHAVSSCQILIMLLYIPIKQAIKTSIYRSNQASHESCGQHLESMHVPDEIRWLQSQTVMFSLHFMCLHYFPITYHAWYNMRMYVYAHFIIHVFLVYSNHFIRHLCNPTSPSFCVDII